MKTLSMISKCVFSGALLLCFLQVTRTIFSTSSLVETIRAVEVSRRLREVDVAVESDGNTPRRPPTKFTTKARPCPKIEMDELKKREILFSQKKEDIKLLDFFNGLCGGTYIEMGALTGKDFSNTYVFNKAFSWKGLLIEPSPKNFQKLQANRPEELALVNAAVCGQARTIHFFEKSGLGAVNGIWEFASPKFRAGAWNGATIEDTTEIECKPLPQIMDERLGHSETHFFDIYSLDIEGAEIEALRSIDFDKVGFGVLLVENQTFNKRKHWAVRTLLESKGYWFLEREGGNDWFISTQFHEIYKDHLMEI